MKRKLLFSVAVLFFSFGVVFSQTVFVEDFDYTAGDQLINHNWQLSGTSNTSPILISNPGLTYTNYPSVNGNAATLATTGQDLFQTFDTVSQGDVYLSFLINVASAQSGDYFIALSPSVSQTTYTARVHAKASGTGYVLGIKKSNESNAPYGTTELSFNKTYLVVIKYTLIAAATNDDIVSVFVFSDPEIPATEPATPEIAGYVGDPSKTDVGDIAYVTLRQGSSSNAAALVIDGIRIATSWNSLFTATGIEDNNLLPEGFSLSQNYPNPFNPETVISYQLANASHVSLKVFDIIGNEVATLVDNYQNSGFYNVRFSSTGKNISSGIYFYTLQADGFTQTRKMLLIK